MSPDESDQPGQPPSSDQRARGGNVPWKPPSVEKLQELLSGYEVIDMLGHGGMGAVYKARQISLDRLVAIKILPPEAEDEEMDFAERFRIEARTMAKMNHPAIVHVHDFGETSDGQLYIVMEFIDGTDVAKMVLAQKKLSPEHALAITAHVCDALKYAHEHGVVHRDIKPANILINMEGAVKVADFGLAKAASIESSHLTKSTVTMGTPDYVAPEALIMGAQVDGRADLYAVGVMLYNMLTGEIPRGFFKMPSELAGCDPRFDAIVRKAMEKDPQVRYQTALDIRRDLDRILTVPVAKAKPPQPRPGPARVPAGPPRVYQPPPRKGSSLGFVAFAMILLAAGGAFLWLKKSGRESVESLPAPPPVTTKAEPATAPPPAIAPAKPEPMPQVASVTTKPELPPPAVSKPAPAPQPDTEATRRLRELDAQFHAALDRDVTKVRNADVADLDTKFTAAIDRALATATNAVNLPEALALREEKKRVESHQPMPADDAADLPATLKGLRETYRTTLAKIEADTLKTSIGLHEKYEQVLAAFQMELTKAGKLDDAVRVTEKQKEVAAQRTAVGRAAAEEIEFITDAVKKEFTSTAEGIVLKGKDKFSTPESFKPPVEITVVAKTDSTNLRLSYAADQLIFNWEMNEKELRLDGGPAAGKHKSGGAGTIPKGEFVTVRWIVTQSSQTVFVNGEQRYEHKGDYSKIDNPVSVYGFRSTVTLKSVKVKLMPAGPELMAGERTARVEAEGTTFKPLRAGELLYGDRDSFKWAAIPAFFSAHQFSQSPKVHEPTLKMKVLTDGVVFMACTSRWAGRGSGTPGDWQNEVTTRAQLDAAGWHAFEPVPELKSTEESHTWIVFYRRCMAGESFQYRTEKYASPMAIIDTAEDKPAGIGGDAGLARIPESGGALTEDRTIQPGDYRDRKKITVGRHDSADPKKIFPVTITSGRGTELFDSTFIIEKGTWKCDGTRFVRSIISAHLDGAMEARNGIFEACVLSKSGSAFTSWFSSKWTLENCIITQQFIANWKLNDYGLIATHCTFYGVDFSKIRYNDDAAVEVKKPWLTIKHCRFVDCKVPESVLIATQECVFETCTFGETEEGIPIKSPLAVRIYCTDPTVKPAAGPSRTIEVLDAAKVSTPAGVTFKHRRRGNIADFGPNGNGGN